MPGSGPGQQRATSPAMGAPMGPGSTRTTPRGSGPPTGCGNCARPCIRRRSRCEPACSTVPGPGPERGTPAGAAPRPHPAGPAPGLQLPWLPGGPSPGQGRRRRLGRHKEKNLIATKLSRTASTVLLLMPLLERRGARAARARAALERAVAGRGTWPTAAPLHLRAPRLVAPLPNAPGRETGAYASQSAHPNRMAVAGPPNPTRAGGQRGPARSRSLNEPGPDVFDQSAFRHGQLAK